MEGRKGGRSGSNRMILIHSNVIKLFKNNTLTHSTVLQTEVVWMRAVTVWMKIFSKENRSYKIYWDIVSLNHYSGAIRRVVNINLEYFFNSYK